MSVGVKLAAECEDVDSVWALTALRQHNRIRWSTSADGLVAVSRRRGVTQSRCILGSVGVARWRHEHVTRGDRMKHPGAKCSGHTRRRPAFYARLQVLN